MQVGISTAALFPKFSTEEAISVIKNLGINVIELFYSTFYEYNPDFSQSLVDIANGMTVNSVHANSINFEPNLFNPTKRVKQDGFYWLEKIARSAQILGCKNYTFHGFHRLFSGSNDNYDRISGHLNDIIDILNQYKINLCMENVFWCTYNKPGFFTEIKRRCPSILGVLDNKQARRSGFSWQKYVEDMAGSIAYAHLSDIDENGKMCPPGRGICDFNDMVKTLKDSGFNGNLLVEVYGGDYKNVNELKESWDFLSEIVYKYN